MLKIILNRRSKAEEVLSEEQAGFRAGRSTVEQIFNCRLIIEKHLQHQRDLYHNFIDFKKAFDRVWHEGLWSVLRGFNVEEELVQIIQALYEHSSSAVTLNSQISRLRLPHQNWRQTRMSPLTSSIQSIPRKNNAVYPS